jgi:hypothetical protein
MDTFSDPPMSGSLTPTRNTPISLTNPGTHAGFTLDPAVMATCR